MRFITDSKVTSITARNTIFSSVFPTTNMLDSKPGHKWISNGPHDVLSVVCSGGTSALYIGAVSADFISYRRVYTGKTITAITSADPGIVTSTAHGFIDGDSVYILSVAGMIELNGSDYTVANATTNTFTLLDSNGDDVDTSGFTAYTSAGTVYKNVESGTILLREIRNLTEFMTAQFSIHSQGWATLSYITDETIIFITLLSSIDKKSTITDWASATSNALGKFTDGASAVQLTIDSKVDIGAVVLFDESTSTDVRQISRDGGTNNIKLHTNSAHGFADGERIFIDALLVSTVESQINNKCFTITNKTSTTVDLVGTSTTFVTLASSATDLGAVSKIHQITQIKEDGTSATGVTLSPSPTTHASITTAATVYKILQAASSGVLRAGRVASFTNPTQGFSDGRKSFSIREETPNGGFNATNRKKVRTPSGNLTLKNVDYNRFMEFAYAQDAVPFACLLFDNLGSTSRHSGFFSFSEVAQGQYDTGQVRSMNFRLREII